MTDIKELALRMARNMGCEFPPDHNTPVTPANTESYTFMKAEFNLLIEELFAAYLAEQEPVDYRYKGADGFWYRRIPSDVRVVQTQPLFAAPPLPEPAPDWLLKTAQNLAQHMAKEFFPDVPQFEVLDDLAGVISQIDNMVCGLPREPITVCAAPSSEEVREIVSGLWAMIETINQGHHAADHHDAITATQAADLIERLAARVPDGCVVVPREPTMEIREAIERTCVVPFSRTKGVWDAMIAAGEVGISLSSSIRPEIDVRCLRITED